MESYSDGGTDFSGGLNLGDSYTEGEDFEANDDCGDGGECIEEDDLNEEFDGEGCFVPIRAFSLTSIRWARLIKAAEVLLM